MAEKVIVTGASGFIGQNCLIPLLENGFEVYAFCRQVPVDKHPDVIYMECDLRDTYCVDQLLKKIRGTYLLHLAWYVEPGKYMHSDQNIEWLSISMNLVQLFVKYGGKRAVTAGTCAEYDWKSIEAEKSVSEIFSIGTNMSIYSCTKYALGEIFHSFMNEYNLSAAHGRVFYLFGPGENRQRLIPSSISALVRRREVILNNGHFVRDYLYVKDVAVAFAEILSSELEGAVNIGMGAGQCLFDILECAEGILGTQGLVKCSAHKNLSREPKSIVANVQKLYSIGWKPRYSMSEALEEYCILLERFGKEERC